MPISRNLSSARGHVAGLSYAVKAGLRQPDDPEFLAAKDNLKALLATEAAERLLAMLPELTDDARVRVADLIKTGLLEVNNGGLS